MDNFFSNLKLFHFYLKFYREPIVIVASTLFDAAGGLINSSSYGVWVEKCGGHYLFGNKIVNWKENMDVCSSLGMSPIWFENVDEQICLTNLSMPTWPLNYNYWTGATQEGSYGRFHWCGANGAVNLVPNLLWANFTPDFRTVKNCVQMKYVKTNTSILLQLSNRVCTDKFVSGCKSASVVPFAAECKVATCPGLPNCTRNLALYEGPLLKDHLSYGTWYFGCGRNFLFTNKLMNWADAWNYCCSIGTQLLSVGEKVKHTCFTRMVNVNQTHFDDFWTAGTQAGCPGTFTWCSLVGNFRTGEVNWKAGSPGANSGDCVAIKTQSGADSDSVYYNDKCDVMKRVICEVRQTGSEFEQLRFECMELWNISDSDLDTLLEPKVNFTTVRLDLQCFLRCIGKFKGLFGDGEAKMTDTIRLMEEATMSSPNDIQKGFEGVSSCNNPMYTDECRKATAMLDCGMKTMPNVTGGMIATGIGSDVVISPPVPCTKLSRNCWNMGLTCLQSSLFNILTSDGYTPKGRLKVGPGPNYRKFFVSHYLPPSMVNIKFAYDYCCKLNMRLVEPQSEADLVVYANLINNPSVYLHIPLGSTQTNPAQTVETYCRSMAPVPESLYQFPASFPNLQCKQTYVFASLKKFARGYIKMKAGTSYHVFICEDVSGAYASASYYDQYAYAPYAYDYYG